MQKPTNPDETRLKPVLFRISRIFTDFFLNFPNFLNILSTLLNVYHENMSQNLVSYLQILIPD